MASFFEPDSYLLDPTSYDDSPSSFLSFCSFSDLAHAATSPFDFSSWEYGSSKGLKSRLKDAPEAVNPSQPPSDGTLSGSSSPRDPFSIAELAFEPSGPVGIFVESIPAKTVADGNPSSSHSYRSSASSTDTWEEPITPGLSNRASIDSFASTSTVHASAYKQATPGYAWDDASTGLGSASGFTQVPHRTTSNPTLNRTQPRAARPIASMPALKEEESCTPSAWFDGTEQVEPTLAQPSTGAALPLTQQPVGGASSLEETNELVEDFGWAFGQYGLGIADIPPESTIFAAFQSDEPVGGPSTTGEDNSHVAHSYPVQPQKLDQQPQQWLPTPTVQDTAEYSYDYSSFSHLPTFTVDPMSIMTAPLGGEEEQSRPSSAPGLNGGEGSGQMLSVPMADAMTRSISSESFVHARRAPPRDLFSYTPQQIPAGPPAPQPLYTTDPSPSFSQYPREMPVTPTLPRRAPMQGLAIQIQPTQYSTYSQSPLPPTPQSATFGEFSTPQMQPVMMTRAGTQPLPYTRRMSGSGPSSVPLHSRNHSHYGRAGSYPQSQEAKEEAQRQEIRRIAASRRLSLAQNGFVSPPSYQESQFIQPLQHQPQYQQHAQFQAQRQAIMGWEGPSAQTASLPVLTTTPLVTVHPPPANQAVQPGAGGLSTPHKIHPPPHPGSAGRQVARLPSSPAKRKVSNTPTKRSPSVKKRQAQGAGGKNSLGETMFINFTSDDAEKLLTGVAPSGSQGKRKREDEMGRALNGEEGVEMVRDGSKRSRSDE